ncbi:protein of unknown function DUF2800 [Vibrio phage 1.009.O._10N.261.51.C9]|nr:protein of unknown function DUF2800 [Vibrio phage 1.009.O._10N.261.51.C9]
MGGQHASIAPSAAPIWGHCSGYLAIKHLAADHDTDHTRAGTASHWVFEQAAVSGLDAEDYIGEADPSGTIVDEGMAEGAQAMVDMVNVIRDEHPHGDELIEERVYMANIHADNWGTLDYARVMLDKRLIILGDYKHGHGVVDVEKNLQLIDYAMGLMNSYGLTLETNQDLVFEFRICQPFAYSPQGPVKTWRATVRELMPIWRQLSVRAHEDPQMTVGSHCRYCPIVGACSAARQAGYSVIDYAGMPFAIDNMSGADLAAERKILQVGLKLLAARAEDIDEQLKHRLKQGEKGTGLALKGTSGRAKWLENETTVIATLKTLGLDVSKPAALTPTQVKAKATTDAQRKALAALQHRPGGKLELIDAGDTPSARAFRK